MPDRCHNDPGVTPLRDPEAPIRTSARVPADLRAHLDRYAARNYRSVSSVVVAAIARYLREESHE